MSAETRLLELVRGQDASEFILSIDCRAGRWVIRCVLPQVENSAVEGCGATFDEAWLRLAPVERPSDAGSDVDQPLDPVPVAVSRGESKPSKFAVPRKRNPDKDGGSTA
ncbi:hypothetical protein [Reyranella sp. CPCC 100927]|uniref:hypothetical protein n=1 Tax=Reyranella sp. CPCC 100927 TaxID=2599616 RepID=UPI0011B41835|nr:hypothetical protein [Reyranella sp. CPCC 100927]TWT13709.1 hypothetical protein FQU96_07270 [Reyranella sp. CPCC 100927]